MSWWSFHQESEQDLLIRMEQEALEERSRHRCQEAIDRLDTTMRELEETLNNITQKRFNLSLDADVSDLSENNKKIEVVEEVKIEETNSLEYIEL